jgi:glycosyltransferase involved in cell wall biosynthesis
LVNLCLYGTVLNSVGTVEKSIASVFRPDAEIVITDGGSIDRTYEKLLEISKEYNLRVYKAPGSTRGLGRQIALMKCPDKSYAAYFDLDDEYNKLFHKAIDWGISTGSQRPLLYLHLKEFAILRGGWRDLNYAEDTEFWTRVGFDYSLPIIAKKTLRKVETLNLQNLELKRYARGIKDTIKRPIIHQLSVIKGYGLSPNEYIFQPAFRKRFYLAPAGALIYMIALMQGIYRYNKQFNNLDLIFYNQLVKLKDPVKEIRADESHVALLINYESAIKIGLINVVKMMRKIGLKPHICTMTKGKLSIVGLKDYSVIKNLNEFARLKILTCNPL